MNEEEEEREEGSRDREGKEEENEEMRENSWLIMVSYNFTFFLFLTRVHS